MLQLPPAGPWGGHCLSVASRRLDGIALPQQRLQVARAKMADEVRGGKKQQEDTGNMAIGL